MAQVFVSYARKDEEFVLKLAQDLRRRGVDLWIDQLDIGEGRWDDQVQTALETCPCFLIVLSPASAGSENVKDELNFALDERKTIIPVLYQQCTIPFRIRRFQWIDFQHNYDHALIKLVDFLPESSKKSRPRLKLEFSARPQRVAVGKEVIWTLALRNTGADILNEVAVRRGQKLLHPNFTLNTTSEKIITFTTSYSLTGSQTEAVTVTAVGVDGQTLKNEVKSTVQVIQPLFSDVIKQVAKLWQDVRRVLRTIFQPRNMVLVTVILVIGLAILSGVYFKDSIIEMGQSVNARIGSIFGGQEWAGIITFSSYRDGNWEIYTLTPDATLTRLTNNRSLDRFPAWSPDGSKLAFVSNRDGNLEIYTLASSRMAARMTNNPAVDQDPAWSPDGSRLAFVSYRVGNGEIYTLNSDGSLTRLTNNPAEEREPAWSPDGSFIAFASNREGNWDIYTLDAGGRVTRLTAHPADDREPAWSPDGSKLVFSSDRDGNWEIYTLDSYGTTIRMTDNPADDREAVWSPDGLSLAFSSDRAAPGRTVYRLDASGKIKPLTDGGADENPDWVR